jgi:hypothetical protein
VKIEIRSRLDACRKQLSDLGPERDNQLKQMDYLTRISVGFQRLVTLALNTTHGADDAFENDIRMRLAPAVMTRMKSFSDEMAKYGEAFAFKTKDGDTSNNKAPRSGQVFECRKEEDVAELIEILHPQTSMQFPKREGIID